MGIINNLRNLFVKDTFYPLYFQGVNPLRQYLDLDTKDQILTAYYQTPTLRAIIDKSADVFSRVDYYLTDKSGKRIDKKINLKHPFYSRSEFLSTYYKQIKLFNECFIYVNSKSIKLFDENTTFLIMPAQNMKVIPKKNIDIKNINSIEDYVSHYELHINGKVVTFKPFEIIHITTSSLKFDNEGYLEPDRSLKSAEQAINVIRSAYEMRIGLNYRKGGTNILVNDQVADNTTQRLNPNDIKESQSDLAKYSFNRDDYQTIVTNAKLQNINLNYPIAQLEINEGITQAKIEIGDVLGFQLHILNMLEGSTYDNVQGAMKSLYTELMIPGWDLLEGEFNDYFVNNDLIYFDYSHIEILQKDRKTEIETTNLLTNEILTLNDYIKRGVISKEIAINVLISLYDIEEQFAKDFITNEIPNDNTEANETITI